MFGIIEWSVGDIQLNRGKFCFSVEIELCDSVIKQQKGGYLKESEAKEERERVIGALYSNHYAVYANTSVQDFYEFWLEEVKKKSLSYNSYYSFKKTVQNYILPLYGRLSMGKLRKNHVKRIYKKTYETSPSVAKIVKTVLTTSFKYALRYGYVEEDYVTGLKWNRVIKKSSKSGQKKALTIQEIQHLLSESRDTPIGLPIMFAVLMGMRRGEIVGLKYTDINYELKTIYIQRQLGRNPNMKETNMKLKTYTKQEIDLKTPASRRKIKIPDMVFEMIMEERTRYERHKNRRKGEFQDLDFIYCSTYGRPRTGNYLGKQLHDFILNHDVPYINWRILRYTYATTILKAGYSLKAVSKTLGHTKKEFTADHYVDMKELIRDFQPSVEIKTENEKTAICEWSLTEEMERLLE